MTCTENNGLCEFCGSDQLWIDFADPEQQALKIAKLPPCLWHICLAIIPLGWLIIALPFFISDIRKKKRIPLSVSWSYILKAFASLAFIAAPVAQIVLLNNEETNSLLGGQILSNTALAVSGLLALIMNELLRNHGAITSGTVTIFWALNSAAFWFYFTTVFVATEYYNPPESNPDDDVIIDYGKSESNIEENTFIIYCVQASLATINFFVSFIPEKLPEDYQDGSYETAISWINSMTYSWLTELISVGYSKATKGDRKGLQAEDVKNVKARDKTSNRFAEFEANWNSEVARVQAINDKKKTKPQKKSKKNKVSDESEENKKEEDDGLLKPSLYRVLWATFYHEILVTAGWKLANDILTFFSPQLIKAILSFIGTKDESGENFAEPEWAGYLYATCMLLVTFMVTFVLQRYWYHASRVGTQARCVLSAAIYQKSLKVNFSNKGTTVGEVVNYMSVDAQRFQDTMNFINFLWSAPLQIIISLFFLYNEIGWAAFMALVVMVCIAPLSMFFTTKMRNAVGAMMKAKDKRIKIMNEILNGMKVLKLYAWEKPYMKKVNDIREGELKLIRLNALYQAVVILLWEITPYLVQVVCFAAYMSESTLSADTVYTAISLFNILRFPINILPMVSIMVITLRVANDRIVKFLYSDELDLTRINHKRELSGPMAIEMAKADYEWKEGGTKALSDFELKLKQGSMVAVVGPVGCGKSAMISGLMGELYTKDGMINVNGNLAYVPQQAWIQNMTLKDNIIFGNQLDEKKYQNVLDVCCLQPDLDILDEGDQTEIGERGINLSGGQKQRVSIARAVYADADIYVFDDPLSAVDAHVGREIFDRVMGPNGMLQGKTRLLVTHSTQYLPDVDDIVVMETGGTILARGDLRSLKAMNNERVETIISVKEREEEKKSDEGGNTEKKKDAKTGDKKEGELVKKEKAEEGALSLDIFKNYFRAFGWGWSLIYVFWSLAYQVGDIIYSIWLSTWVDAIPYYDTLKSDGSQNCIKIIPGQDQDTVRNIEVFSNFSSIIRQNDVADDGLLPLCDCGSGINGAWSGGCYGDPFYLGIYGGLGITIGLLSFTKSLTMLKGIIRSARTFQSEVLTGVMKSPMSFFDTTPSGRIVNRFGKDLDAVDMTIPGSIRQWISLILRVIGTLYILARVSVWFLIVIPPLGILFYLVERYFIAANRQVKRLESTTRSPIYSSFGETISGSSLIRAYNVQNRFIKENFEKVDFNLKFQYASLMCNRWLGMRLEAFANLIVFAVAIFAVVSRGDDSVTAADMGLALTYAQTITQILNFLIRVTAELEVNLVAVERLSEYSDLEPEADWRKENLARQSDGTWMKKGKVDFEKYSLRYRDGLPLVLKQIQCSIAGGEKIGIVGRTGAGKSSLTMGMFRLVEPAEGNINIDKVQTNKIGLHDLREELVIIPQEPVLFSGTLRENLDPFENFDDEKLWRALDQAHLKGAVSDFEKKLDHEVAENGSNLSVGERQLVCLARALLRRSKILILDEATSAVDNNTDGLIQSTIRSEFASMTVLTIAHRLNTILDYDRVIVLDKGEIVEFDSPIGLFKKNGIFASMCQEANLSEGDITKIAKGGKVESRDKTTEIEKTNDAPENKPENYESTDF